MAKNRTSLVVFDFDDTFLSVNSDTWILQQLYPPALEALLQKRKDNPKAVWTDLMDEAFFRLKCAGVTVDQIQSKILQAPVMPGFLDCVRYLEERCEASQESVDVAIVSDANTLFIEWILASHSIQFCQIFSNPATLLNDRLHVSYYHQNSQCGMYRTTPPITHSQDSTVYKEHVQRKHFKSHIIAWC